MPGKRCTRRHGGAIARAGDACVLLWPASRASIAGTQPALAPQLLLSAATSPDNQRSAGQSQAAEPAAALEPGLAGRLGHTLGWVDLADGGEHGVSGARW